MRIREIEEKDNHAIEKILKQSLESFQLNLPGTAYFDPQLKRLAQYYDQQEKAAYWVAVNKQDEVLGGVGIGPFDTEKGICELQKLYVKPDAQRKGIAKQLMETALDFANEHYNYCYLETFEKLETANRLYTIFGFEKLKSSLEGTEHSACDTWYLKKLL